jgi:hypothetical protein
VGRAKNAEKIFLELDADHRPEAGGQGNWGGIKVRVYEI